MIETSTTEETDTRAEVIKPSRLMYVVGGVILIVGIALFCTFLIKNISGIADSLTQIIVPGQTEVAFSEPGNYTIFYEYQSVIDGKEYSTNPDLSGLMCQIKHKQTKEEIPLSPSSMNSNYSVGGRAGFSVLQFSVSEPGEYLFKGYYNAGSRGPEAVLSVGTGFMKRLLVTIVGALAILFSALGCGALVCVITFLKRRKAHESV